MSFKVGEYVQFNPQAGIVYEEKEHDTRIQLADGMKIRYLRPELLKPADPSAIAEFESNAVEGMTPEAIIAREAGEMGDSGGGSESSEDEEESGEDASEPG